MPFDEKEQPFKEKMQPFMNALFDEVTHVFMKEHLFKKDTIVLRDTPIETSQNEFYQNPDVIGIGHQLLCTRHPQE